MDPGRAFEQSEPWKIDSTQKDNLSKLKKRLKTVWPCQSQYGQEKKELVKKRKEKKQGLCTARVGIQPRRD
jgi:hypothetical protein